MRFRRLPARPFRSLTPYPAKARCLQLASCSSSGMGGSVRRCPNSDAQAAPLLRSSPPSMVAERSPLPVRPPTGSPTRVKSLRSDNSPSGSPGTAFASVPSAAVESKANMSSTGSHHGLRELPAHPWPAHLGRRRSRSASFVVGILRNYRGDILVEYAFGPLVSEDASSFDCGLPSRRVFR
jgi:hypothetical protein